MAERNIKTRIVHKHDIEENWNKAVNFIPKQGEIIVYDIDNNYDYERFKIGDGITYVYDLPFVCESIIARDFDVEITSNVLTMARGNDSVQSIMFSIDSELSDTSQNPVQNRVIFAKFDEFDVTITSHENVIQDLNENSVRWVTRYDDTSLTFESHTNQGQTVSAVSQTYVDNAIGDIETALDNIIAIQNTLIGGESV